MCDNSSMDANSLAISMADPVRQAGGILLRATSSKLSPIFKDDGSATTDADLASQRLLVAGLHALAPDVPFLVEEQDARQLRELQAAHPRLQFVAHQSANQPLPPSYFSIDPADGTSFLRNAYPVYAVSAALVERGEPAACALFMPAVDLLLTAALNNGCRMNGTPIRIEHAKPLRESLIGLDNCRSVSDDFRRRVIDPVVRSCLYPPNLPSVASGFDVVLSRTGAWISSNTHNWDVAGTCLAVREAGGVCHQLVLSEQGVSLAPIPWDRQKMPPLIFAAREDLIAEIVAEIRPA